MTEARRSDPLPKTKALSGYTLPLSSETITSATLEEIQSGYAADFEQQGWSRIQGSGEISNDIFFGLYIRIIEGESQELIVNAVKRDDLGKERLLVIVSLGEK